MDEQTYMDFTTTLGEEYCEVISPLCEHGAEPHDGYEVFGKAFGYDDITPDPGGVARCSSLQRGTDADSRHRASVARIRTDRRRPHPRGPSTRPVAVADCLRIKRPTSK